MKSNRFKIYFILGIFLSLVIANKILEHKTTIGNVAISINKEHLVLNQVNEIYRNETTLEDSKNEKDNISRSKQNLNKEQANEIHRKEEMLATFEVEEDKASINKEHSDQNQVEKYYKHEASLSAPNYVYSILAGSGIPGNRDGLGLYARFNAPSDISLGPQNKFLYLLDEGNNAIKKISLKTQETITYIDFKTTFKNNFRGSLPDGFSKLKYKNGKLYLIEGNGRGLWILDNRNLQKICCQGYFKNEFNIIDVDFYENKPVIITKGENSLSILNGGKWESLLSWSKEEDFDSVFINGDNTGLASSTTQKFRLLNLKKNSAQLKGALSFKPKGIVWDALRKRIVGYDFNNIYVIKQDDKGNLNSIKMNFHNLHGREIGELNTETEYRTNIFHGINSLNISSVDGFFYISDKLNNRIIKITDLFDNKQLYSKATNYIYGGDFYQPIKPFGTNRILWYTSSVYWAPGGNGQTAMNRGGPVVLRNLLNMKNLANWEVMHVGAGAPVYYSAFYEMAEKAIENYGIDYIFTIIDLKNFASFLTAGGLNIPALVDNQGVPKKPIDAELAGIPLFQRKYSPKIQNLLNYLKINYGSKSSSPLINEEGKIHISGGIRTFYNIWVKDPIFQKLLINIFTDLLVGLNDVCIQNNVKLVVFLGPIIKDTFNEKRFDYNFDPELANGPILKKLTANKISTYDLTYNLLSKYFTYFPFSSSRNDAHPTYLFHQALAEAIVDTGLRYRFLTFEPLPKKFPGKFKNSKTSNDKFKNRIYTKKGSELFVLRDLWNETDDNHDYQDTKNVTLKNLLTLALNDIKHFDGKTTEQSSPSQFNVLFVFVKNLDEYDELDLGGLEKVSSMKFNRKDLKEIMLKRDLEDWTSLSKLINFEKY
jgi:hypothetical protein